MKTTRDQIRSSKCPKCELLLEIKKAETYFVTGLNGRTDLQTKATIGCEDCDVSYTIFFTY